MSIEENKTLIRRFFDEAASQGDFRIIDEVVAPNFVYNTSALPEYRGPEGFKQFLSEHCSGTPDVRDLPGLKQSGGALFAAFPDSHLTIDAMVAEGDKVAKIYLKRVEYCRMKERG
jgi:hypothetical protein